jgi:hypothetical protein
MARFSPFSDKRPAPIVERFTLTNHATGQADEIALTYLDDILTEKANDLALRLTFQYVGVSEQGIEPSAELPPVDGQYIEVSANLCQKVANAFTQQAQRPDGGNVYTCEELFAFAATNDRTGVWEQIQNACGEVNGKGAKRKNEGRRAAGTGSKTLSDGNNLTPKSLNEQIASSLESTGDWGRLANTLQEIETVLK